MDAHGKVAASHLAREAYLYIRQSSLRQVMENTESTKRQYALRQRAIALGWSVDRIVVIDSDLGQSGASAADREGFQRLVSEVGLGNAGIVMGLEVSRLARNNVDWHRLLEICALSETLILDEDGIYDPAHFNDRLLLGLKGTMSEAELHMLRLRLHGGMINKARRGELRTPLPIGLVNDDATEQVMLDPDKRIRESVELLFRVFARTGSATKTVREFNERGLSFPRHTSGMPGKRKVIWATLEHSLVLRTLHNPRYAGAFCWGRHRTSRLPNGKIRIQMLPRDEWRVLLPDTHVGYISWKTFEENQRVLLANSAAHDGDRRRSPPREGPSLLQGMVICGKCGRRMTVRYTTVKGKTRPIYICQSVGIANGTPICESIPGSTIDKAIGKLLIETVTPLALEVSLAVQEELAERLQETDRLRKKEVEHAQYEVELSRRRFMRVDPDNRMVADTLEADWNQKLRALSEAQEEYERKREEDLGSLDAEQTEFILKIATDFPKLWNSPSTENRDRKRMLRLLIEDVTLRKEKMLIVQVRFRGGRTHTLTLDRPLNATELRRTPQAVVEAIDKLLDTNTDGEIAELLNHQELRSGEGKPFCRSIVRRIRETYRLNTRYERLRAAGMLTLEEVAAALNVSGMTAKVWRRKGLITGHRYNDHGECLYEPPGPDAPIKHARKGLTGALKSQSHDRPTQ